MKTAESLFELLGIKFYTQRHKTIVNNFIKSGDEDAKKLLDLLGDWDDKDLKKVETWMKS